MILYVFIGGAIGLCLLSLVCGGFMYGLAILKYIINPKVLKYGIKDIIAYFKERKWRMWTDTGIIMYGGLFGTGKTLQMVQYAEHAYKNYDNIEIYSNVTLNNVPFTPFECLEQLLEPVEDGWSRIYICDEFGSLYNSRNYKNNEITETEYLTVLNQIRKEHKTLVISTQRYGMVDKVFRQVCKRWIECRKVWRFYFGMPYDPYELEYTLDPTLVQPCQLIPNVLFADDKVYGAYNTFERVIGFGKNKLKITGRTDESTTVNRDTSTVHMRRKYARKIKG